MKGLEVIDGPLSENPTERTGGDSPVAGVGLFL